MRVEKSKHSVRIWTGAVCLFLTLDSARATKPSVRHVPPPIPIRVTKISVQPSGPLWTGDDILIQCTVQADALNKGPITTMRAPIFARLGFPQNLALQSTIKRWIVGADAQPLSAQNVEGYYTLDEVVSGKPMTFCLSFKAHNCGYLQADFAYGYYTDRGGEAASSREVVLSRCILKSHKKPTLKLAKPPRNRSLGPDSLMGFHVLPRQAADVVSVYPESIKVGNQDSAGAGPSPTVLPLPAPGADSCACR